LSRKEFFNSLLEYEKREQNRRRLLSESFLFGEAAMQLWHNKYNEDTVKEALLKAQAILQEAIDVGYENARLYISLANVEAALGNTTSAEITLRKISRATALSWVDVIEQARKFIDDNDMDALIDGFILGIADSSSWNSLGTYSISFLNNDEMGLQLYETGRRLNPKNSIILTNLSRVLIRIGNEESLSLAKKYLHQAAQYSTRNRAFVWWRDVKSQLDNITGRHKPSPIALGPPSFQKPSFKNIQQRFEVLLAGQIDGQERGRLFETIFRDLLKITFGPDVVYGSHLVTVGSERQVDASFKWRNFYYRVEVKWHDRPVGPDKIDIFRTILKTAEVRGIFVSMSGYTNDAIVNAIDLGKDRMILLIDGTEIKSIFQGTNRLELILDRKIDTFQRTGNPYDAIKNKVNNATE